jgi:hypothetical protein
MSLLENIKNENKPLIFVDNNNKLKMSIKIDNNHNIDIKYINSGWNLMKYKTKLVHNASPDGNKILNKLNYRNYPNIINDIIIITASVNGGKKGFPFCHSHYKYDELVVIILENNQYKLRKYLMYESTHNTEYKYDFFTPIEFNLEKK